MHKILIPEQKPYKCYIGKKFYCFCLSSPHVPQTRSISLKSFSFICSSVNKAHQSFFNNTRCTTFRCVLCATFCDLLYRAHQNLLKCNKIRKMFKQIVYAMQRKKHFALQYTESFRGCWEAIQLCLCYISFCCGIRLRKTKHKLKL